jgi:hypothetical protein
MAFGSNTGFPCRLRMKSEKASDGRSVVALGSNDKHALFFPVRNISLPDGMNLTSLIQLNKRIPFERNTFKPTGCAPRCSKTSQPIKAESSSSSSSQSNKKNKSKRKHNACSCLSNETPGQGKAERCKRPRHCKPAVVAAAAATADAATVENKGHHHRHHHHHKSHKEVENNGSSSGFRKNLSQDAGRQKDKEANKDAAILIRLATGSSSETETDWVQHVENNRRGSNSAVSVDSSTAKQRGSDQPSSSSSSSNAMSSSSKKRTSAQRRERKDNERRKKPSNAEANSPPDEPALIVNRRIKNKPTIADEEDPALHLSHKGDSRLIRHMYRKIRAHPELAEELAAML